VLAHDEKRCHGCKSGHGHVSPVAFVHGDVALLGPRDADERFVVCYRGELVASTRVTWTGPGGDLS